MGELGFIVYLTDDLAGGDGGQLGDPLGLAEGHRP